MEAWFSTTVSFVEIINYSFFIKSETYLDGAYLLLTDIDGVNLLGGNLNIVIRQRIARQRLDNHPAIRARNNKTNIYSSLQGNSQRAKGLARYRVICFLCGLRYATIELFFLRCQCRGYITRVRENGACP
jgi:hypothetical protein